MNKTKGILSIIDEVNKITYTYIGVILSSDGAIVNFHGMD